MRSQTKKNLLREQTAKAFGCKRKLKLPSLSTPASPFVATLLATTLDYLFAVFFVFGFKTTRDVKRETSFHHPPSISLFTSVKLSPGSVSIILKARNNNNNNNNKINASQSLSNASYLLNFPA